MVQVLPDALLSPLSEFIAARVGLHFPRERWNDLGRAIAPAAKELGYRDAESCIHGLLSSPLTRREVEILASHLTVGETYFFRERASFDGLEKHILPELIRSRRESGKRLRVWSAGCSTGEEPYSIAILLAETVPDLKDWNITILATDINARSLRKASRGVYTDWSFRDVPPRLKEKYFSRTREGHFEISPRVKEPVTLAYLNLADDAYPSLENNTNAMDIVFCRNVLMYFEPERAKKVARNLHRALVEGGWLIVSPAEASHVLFPQYIACNFPGAILYRKDSSLSAQGLTIEQFRHAPVEAPALPLPPPFDLYAEPEQAFPQGTGQFPPLQTEGPEAAAPEPTPYEPTPYEQASELYEQGRYAEAAGKFRAALSRDPVDARVMALLAKSYANQGNLAEALEWCGKAVAADKLNPGWCYLQAAILQEQGQAEAAAKALHRALYLDQNHALAHFALGNLARRQGKPGESGKHYRNALSVLRGRRPEEPLPESEGLTAGRLVEIIQSTISSEAVNER
ncbi:MAG: tetratricopeptide repeat protein [Betaproteobacteria bacterium]|nr:tetratricopeptide repeat protein [Betaproteobacteria bacterium]